MALGNTWTNSLLNSAPFLRLFCSTSLQRYMYVSFLEAFAVMGSKQKIYFSVLEWLFSSQNRGQNSAMQTKMQTCCFPDLNFEGWLFAYDPKANWAQIYWSQNAYLPNWPKSFTAKQMAQFKLWTTDKDDLSVQINVATNKLSEKYAWFSGSIVRLRYSGNRAGLSCIYSQTDDPLIDWLCILTDDRFPRLQESLEIVHAKILRKFKSEKYKQNLHTTY
jgi:hypothetical protein